MEWEIRQTGTAGMVNGGGWNPAGAGSGGVPYNEQDAAQYNLTGVTSAGAGNTVLSAAAADDMIGNVGKVVSGTNFTASWFEVTSVVVGVSITFSTNLGGTAITTGIGANGVINIGGALSLNSTLDDDWGEQLVAGNKVWVQYNASVISLGESVAIATPAGTAAAVITFEGFTTVHGDLNNAVLTSSNTPTIACGSSFLFTTPTFTNVKFINFTGSNTSVLTVGSSSKVIGCKSVNSSVSTGRTAIAAGSTSTIMRCEAISYRGYAIGTTNGATCFFANYCHDSDVGIRGTSTTAYQCIGNIVASCVTAAIQFTGASTDIRVFYNLLYGRESIGGIGLSLATGITNVIVLDNIICGFTTGVSVADANTCGIDDFNCYRNNNSNVNSSLNWQQGPNNTSNDPVFTNVLEVAASDATISGAVISSASSDFSNVTDNADFCYLINGTAGPTFGKYLITSHTGTSVTVFPTAVGNSAVADHGFSVTTGMDFLPTGAV